MGVQPAYVASPPIFQRDRITTPLPLIAGGKDDATAGWRQAGEAYAGFDRLGRTCTLQLYPEEEHVPLEWREANRRDLIVWVMDWL